MKLSKDVEKGMSRREFVKSTALKGAAVVAIGAGGLVLPVSARSTDSARITAKTIKEAARETKVCRTADVVVKNR